MLKAGIIGCGNIGGGYDQENFSNYALTHAKAYQLCESTHLVAAADSDTSKLSEFGKRWNVDNLYAGLEDMLSDSQLDILSICSPQQFHYEHLQRAFDYDIKGIFCEKPLTDNLQTAKEIYQKGKDRLISINYFRRWNSSLENLKQDLNSGVYGSVKSCTLHYTKGIKVNGTHLIDLMRWFFGEPINIQKHFVHKNYNDDPGVDFTLVFDKDIKSDFIHIPDVPYVFVNFDFLTEHGRITVSQRGQSIEFYGIVKEPSYKLFNMLKQNTVINTEWQNSMLNAVDELAECINKNSVNSSCTIFDGLRSMEIVETVLNQL